jgi:hypothetical protein
VECRVGAVIRGESGITWGEWISAATVQVKNSPLWKTNPKQQLGYLQVKNWARMYTPGAILGVYSDDELAAHPMERDITPPVPKVPDFYSQADFDTNFPAWCKAIQSGKRTAEDIIAMVGSKAKAPLTEPQKEAIRDCATEWVESNTFVEVEGAE